MRPWQYLLEIKQTPKTQGAVSAWPEHLNAPLRISELLAIHRDRELVPPPLKSKNPDLDPLEIGARGKDYIIRTFMVAYGRQSCLPYNLLEEKASGLTGYKKAPAKSSSGGTQEKAACYTRWTPQCLSKRPDQGR